MLWRYSYQREYCLLDSKIAAKYSLVCLNIPFFIFIFAASVTGKILIPVCVCVQTDVFIAMELMGTCAEKLKKRIQGPIPERILGKMTVAVSGINPHIHRYISVTLLT